MKMKSEHRKAKTMTNKRQARIKAERLKKRKPKTEQSERRETGWVAEFSNEASANHAMLLPEWLTGFRDDDL